MQMNLEFQEAARLLAQQVTPVNLEYVPLTASLGRILGETVRAGSDVPPFDRSPFDGYAFRSEDSQTASPEHPATLRILEEIPAGSVGKRRVVRGTAAKILTGAPIPVGADCVCKFEDTTFTDTSVTITRSYRSGGNIVLRGEDLTAGDIVARQLIAALNMNKSFYLPPRFALLETANNPGEALDQPGIEGRLDAFAGNIRRTLLHS